MSSTSKLPSAQAWLPLALLAIAAPTLLAAHESPSVTFYNQVLALFGWGLWTAALAGPILRGQSLASPRHQGPMWALSAMLLLNAGLALAAPYVSGLPLGLAMMGGGMALSALLVFVVAWRAGLSDQGHRVFDVFCEALAWAGVAGMVLALIQVFHPAWADGSLIAEPTMPGRAVGNLRQPNHFSTLLVWSCCAAAWLGARGRWPRPLAIGAIVLMIGGVVFTASRTGTIAMLFLAVWGWRDRDLPLRLRQVLMLAPVIYGAWWGGMWLWSHLDTGVAFAAEARLHDRSDISSSRFKIWANVLDLIAAHPWTGVGYGEFNLAWTLTPFPTRPVAFFDHTHNVLLQWAVEFGLPLAGLMTVLSLWGLWGLLGPGLRKSADPVPGQAFAGTPAGAAAVIVTLVGLHSLLEYPLWYSYFLLPTAFAWGMGLAARARQANPGLPPQAVDPSTNSALMTGALAISIFTAWCTWDFQAAANIYSPREGAGPLSERIKFGQHTTWFAYQADYANVTGVEEDEPAKPPLAFNRTLHNLVDARLMMAYARSLAEHGEVDKGRFVVDRLREFRNATSQAFLDECKDEPDIVQVPFQCTPAEVLYDWRELLPARP
ncbi:MAG: Wzy polymerase domain-containing protein [Aquabacterium sp.]|uniref:PglL family O-oligosaccharyltransferase n=1 Tax=Aquabacterium sp. TaxID=1872578 RepID=UPI0027171582|nr:O-antigen ligase family protein [Aquabacterium sp.]MDO9005491.1 Wzy polymerase domain-containing protein [Aquabacterium sp.]